MSKCQTMEVHRLLHQLCGFEKPFKRFSGPLSVTHGLNRGLLIPIPFPAKDLILPDPYHIPAFR
jgi:hypothetical protein